MGKISQVPPIFSAVRIDGKRAYDLARKGHDINISSREVEVYSLSILSFEFPFARFCAEVSAGTYIRSLGRDIGESFGLGGVITELRRTKIENWSVENAIPRNAFEINSPSLPYEEIFPDFGVLEAPETFRTDLLNGVAIPLASYAIIRESKGNNPVFIRLSGVYFFLAEIEDAMVVPKRGRIE